MPRRRLTLPRHLQREEHQDHHPVLVPVREHPKVGPTAKANSRDAVQSIPRKRLSLLAHMKAIVHQDFYLSPSSSGSGSIPR